MEALIEKMDKRSPIRCSGAHGIDLFEECRVSMEKGETPRRWRCAFCSYVTKKDYEVSIGCMQCDIALHAELRASGTRGVFGVDFECCIAANIDDTDSQTISQVCGCIEPSRKCVVASVFSKSGKHKGELVEILKVLDVKELKILKFPSSDVVVSWTMLSESMGELCFIGGHVQRNLAARKVLLVRSKSQIWLIPLMYTFLRYWRHTTL